MDEQSYKKNIEKRYTDKLSYNDVNILLNDITSKIPTAKIEETGVYKNDHKNGLELLKKHLLNIIRLIYKRYLKKINELSNEKKHVVFYYEKKGCPSLCGSKIIPAARNSIKMRVSYNLSSKFCFQFKEHLLNNLNPLEYSQMLFEIDLFRNIGGILKKQLLATQPLTDFKIQTNT